MNALPMYDPMLEARLDSLRDWGYNLGNGAYVVRFRAYREGYGVRLKAPKGFAKEARLRSCPASSMSAATAIDAG